MVVEKFTYLSSTLSKSIVREHQTCKSECSLWPTQQEYVKLQRHLGGNQNQDIPSCHSYHPPLWLWNVDNLSMAYTEAKPLSHEHSRHYMAKTPPQNWSFNSGFSFQHQHYLDAITASLSQSCPHERSLPHEKTALWRTISGQALPSRPEKSIQRHTEGLHEIFRCHP